MAQPKLTRDDRKILQMLDRVDSLIFGRASQLWESGTRHLAGYSMPYLVALLETRPQRDIERFHPAGFAVWLSMAPAGCRYPLQRLALRAQTGPEWGEVPATNDVDLLNAREYVNKILFKADERARLARNARERDRRQRLREAPAGTDTHTQEPVRPASPRRR